MKKLICLLLLLSTLSLRAQNWKKYIVVATDSSGDYTSIQQAVNAVRDFSYFPVTIFIKKGVYHEKLFIPSWKTGITLIGESRDSTIITNSDYSGKPYPGGKDSAGKDKFGTFNSYTVLIQGNDITAQNLTFINASGAVGQAVALHVEGDRCIFRNCRLLGYQDTLYAGRESSRQFYDSCYIEGTTDFIFGAATVVFKDCTIHSIRNSYITAASTTINQADGFVFIHCNITAADTVTKVYLGRPWRPYAATLFMNCTLGRHILPEGWHNWDNAENEQTARYREYNNNGPGANTSKRVSWSKQLRANDAKAMTITKILNSWDPTLRP
jgi:pectinesterase